jgi:predicted metalloprotease
MKRLASSVIAAALLTAGCSQQATPAGPPDPTTVAGLQVTDGESGPKPGARDSGRKVANSDDSGIDRLAANAVADVEKFWEQQFPEAFGQRFQPIRQLLSYDSGGAGQTVCRTRTAGLVNAFYCSGEDVVAWDRGELLPMLNDSFGSISVVAVLAHELGHAVQFRLGVGQAASSIVKEQQADCYTGAYFRWVAEGRSAQLQVSTGPGLNQILSTLFFIRDSAGTSFDAQGAHGNAFDRVSAFQFGFTDGARRCAKIDAAEVQNRITQLSFAPEDEDVGLGQGNLRVDDRQALTDLTNSLRGAFPQTAVRINSTQSRCADAKQTKPAAYCPATDAVGISMPDLVKIGTPPQRGRRGGIGDFAAFAEVASRYTLSVQRAAGMPVEGDLAAQRTACLTGGWAATIMVGKNAPLQLSPGDLDEAVAEMLAQESLIAADVNGDSVPSGFARVTAFSDGFSGGTAVCAGKYK